MKISKSFIQRSILAISLVVAQSFYMKTENLQTTTFQQHLRTIVGNLKNLPLKLNNVWETKFDRLRE